MLSCPFLDIPRVMRAPSTFHSYPKTLFLQILRFMRRTRTFSSFPLQLIREKTMMRNSTTPGMILQSPVARP